MVVWGGLRPIVTQVVVDVLGLVGFGYTVVTIPSRTNTMVLGVVSLLTILLSGNWTNRWTVIFPMIPLVSLQIIRRVVFHYSNKNKRRSACLSYTIGSLCFLLIFVAGGLSLLFPAVELPPLPSSVYNVGVVDVFLPTKIQYKSTIPDIHEGVCSKESDHVTVRILYPTMDEVGSPIPYLRPHTSEAFCQETMKYGAPPPLKEFGWMLHTWRLTQIPAFHHAQPLLLGKSSPMIVFSPGVGGTAEIYSYQTLALAANGYVVVVVEHADGSAPVVSRQDGSVLRRDVSVEQVSFTQCNCIVFRRVCACNVLWLTIF